jgi:hypothetical protein
MPAFQRPTARVVALKDFIAAPGRIATAGDVVELDESAARQALSLGNARPLAEDDEPGATPAGAVDTRDPQPRSRDPFFRRKQT